MKKIIGIDFDGTCVTDLYPYVGDNIGAASVLRELGDKNLLILYTVRDGKYLQDAVDWFRYNHINLYSVNYNPEPVSSSPKLYCDYYIDDRNIGTPLTDNFSVEDHNSAIVLPKGTIRRLTGRDLKWEDDPISLKSVIEGLPHVDIEFYKQKIINFVKWI